MSGDSYQNILPEFGTYTDIFHIILF